MSIDIDATYLLRHDSKTTSQEDYLAGEQPQEDDLKGRWPQGKTTSQEDKGMHFTHLICKMTYCRLISITPYPSYPLFVKASAIRISKSSQAVYLQHGTIGTCNAHVTPSQIHEEWAECNAEVLLTFWKLPFSVSFWWKFKLERSSYIALSGWSWPAKM